MSPSMLNVIQSPDPSKVCVRTMVDPNDAKTYLETLMTAKSARQFAADLLCQAEIAECREKQTAKSYEAVKRLAERLYEQERPGGDLWAEDGVVINSFLKRAAG